MRTLLLLCGVCLIGSGCGKKTSTTTANNNSGTPSSDPVFGAIQGTRQAVQRVVTANEMKDLHLFIEMASLTEGKMPTIASITASLKQSGSKAFGLVESGDIVLTGATRRESCWAYEKDAAAKGGWIVLHTGPERVDAETAKKWLNQR